MHVRAWRSQCMMLATPLAATSCQYFTPLSAPSTPSDLLSAAADTSSKTGRKAEEMSNDFVLLISGDGYSFVVPRKLAFASGTLKRMLDEDGELEYSR
jgi:hypothetical protein